MIRLLALVVALAAGAGAQDAAKDKVLTADGTPFTYGTANDGTQVVQAPKQSANFIGARYNLPLPVISPAGA